jgi:pyrroline-5-carboxylate reductase
MSTPITNQSIDQVTNKCIGFIGAGVMGTAIIKSLLNAGLSANQICVFEKDPTKAADIASNLGVNLKGISEHAESCDVLFLAVKPQDLGDLLTKFNKSLKPKCLVISIAAGKTTAFIEEALGQNNPVIRVMPNTPAQIGKGVSAISAGKFAGAEDLALANQLMSASGIVVEVPENQQDAVTALSGSGPAYFFNFVEEMIKGGIALGLTEEIATKLAIGTISGSAAMLQESGLDAATLRKNVTSPNGTTAAALNVFSESNLSEIVGKAMKAARDRAQELA